MKKFEKIIGYTAEKEELIRIADILKNNEVYTALGAAAPRGLLLYGVPGVGKTLMAGCLIEASGRPAFTCRKTESDGKFLNTIKKTFQKAAANAPSIVFLDDVDKFANDDMYHLDSEEFVTVQSCMDELKDKEVFVLATANDTRYLPKSLLRAGRFDRKMNIRPPKGEDAERVIAHYFKGKQIAGDINARSIAAILEGRSSAELESIVNEAALIVGYRREQHITMEQMTEVCMRVIYQISEIKKGVDISGKTEISQAVWHEAGHVAVAETLCPGSVSLVNIGEKEGSPHGITKSSLESLGRSFTAIEADILISLAGRAAVEIFPGTLDLGSCADQHSAFRSVGDLIENKCINGFQFYCEFESISIEAERERAEAALMERYYERAKEIILSHRGFWEATARALAEKGLLFAEDVAEIRRQCEGVPAIA